MKFVLLLSILTLGVISHRVWPCAGSGGACSNATSSAGQGCKLPGGGPTNTTCFIDTSAGCYTIVNSTGKDVFIPTNTDSEFNAFIAHTPASVTATAGTAGSTCWPTCTFSSSCPGVAGSVANPP